MHPFPATNSQLIASLADAANQAEWVDFVRIYEPALMAWFRRRGLRPADVQDCSQRVMVRLVRSLHTFRSDGQPAAFRRWLHRVARNEVVSFLRQESRHGRSVAGLEVAQLAELAQPVPATSEIDRAIELDYRRHLFQLACEVVRQQVAANHWSAFWKTMVLQEPTPTVAHELAMSVGAVYVTKGRVLKQLQVQIAAMELPI